MIVRGERLIERSLLRALRQQFRDVAASIVDRLPLANWFSAEDVVILQQRATRAIHLNLKLHVQFAAVAQYRLVNRRKTRRAAVEIISFIEGAFLRAAIAKDQLRSST